VQSAGGAIYLRASEPIPPTRLQLQDVESGALILLDIAAEPAKAARRRWSPCASSRRACARRATAARQQRPRLTTTRSDAASWPARETPVAVVLTRYAAQNLYAPLRTVEPVAGIGRVNLRRDLRWTPCCRHCRCARALAAWRLEDQWVTAVRLTNTSGAGSTSTRARCRATSWRRPSSTNLGPAGTRRRHHGGLPRHPWPRPGRVAAAGAQARSTRREPAAAAAGPAEGGPR
jgi:hypothetical protein